MDDLDLRTAVLPRRRGRADLAPELPRELRTSLTAALFQELTDSRSDEERGGIRDRIVLANASVARSTARRYRGRGIDLEDLEQTAYLTLVLAVRRFDPARGTDFLSFAVPTIVGELKRHFRDHGWTVRVPRRVQEVQRLIERADAPEAEQQRYGLATVAGLVEQLAVPAREIEAALLARGCFAPASLDAELDGPGAPPARGLVELDQDARDAAEARAMLEPLWRQLAPRDRMILRLRYVEDHTQRAIAAKVGLTQAHVSRILAGLLEDLRSQLVAEVGSSRRAG